MTTFPMASSSSSKLYSPLFFTSTTDFPAISRAELYAFHYVDRALFTRLVLELGRNHNQSLRVMALWIWLERASLSSSVYTISKFPNTKLNILFDESLFCLKSVDDELGIANVQDVELPLIQSIARTMSICPKFFVEKRISILSGVEKALQDVCVKAFDDILEKLSMKLKFKSNGVNHVENIAKTIFSHDMVPLIGSNSFAAISNVSKIKGVNMPMHVGPLYSESTIVHGSLPLGSINLMHQPLKCAVSRHLCLSNQKEIREMPPDERTIFLTFSKGYPIPEAEINDFFTRSFGDLVEQVCMQDVPKDEQPLYARLVLRNPSALYTILEGRSKAKFSINGKHVWARKYVHKIKKSSTTI